LFDRILNIWKDRKIYSDEFIDDLKSHMHATKSIVGQSSDSSAAPPAQSSITVTRAKSEDLSAEEDRKRKYSASATEPPPVRLKQSLREEIARELAQAGSNIQPPDHIELISMLQELEKSASSDAVVRSRIAELPSKVSDLNEIKNIRDKSEALDLAEQVNDALVLLDNYNSRLQQELIARKQTALLLGAFVRQQLAEIDNDQRLCEDWQKKFKQVQHVKSELEIHYDSLPDLAKIDQVACLTPLPSAGDLFSS
jgi:regulator of Ty1 transposition protein 103